MRTKISNQKYPFVLPLVPFSFAEFFISETIKENRTRQWSWEARFLFVCTRHALSPSLSFQRVGPAEQHDGSIKIQSIHHDAIDIARRIRACVHPNKCTKSHLQMHWLAGLLVLLMRLHSAKEERAIGIRDIQGGHELHSIATLLTFALLCYQDEALY